LRIAPATPDDSTWVVETGRPNMPAAPMPREGGDVPIRTWLNAGG